MTTSSSERDDTPLPIIVAKRWNFPLAFVETDEGLYYAVQDWMRGILGGDVRKLLSYIRRHSEINLKTRMFRYKTTNKKMQQRPFVNEDGLLYLLVNARLKSGRDRLVDVRNFVANLSPQYEYLRCSPVQERKFNESDFQSALISALRAADPSCEIHEYHPTPSGHVIDILVKNRIKTSIVSMIIECKIKVDDFYKAVGQICCYRADLERSDLNTQHMILAIAMPYEEIDDYMRLISSLLSVQLISIVDGVAVDAVSRKPLFPL